MSDVLCKESPSSLWFPHVSSNLAGDHCCRETVEECPLGERTASIMLALELPEWFGQLPPELVELTATTSTLDAGTRLVKRENAYFMFFSFP